jgi:hypothetical protein
MRQMIGGALRDLSFRIEPQIFAYPGAAFVLVEHHEAVGTDEKVDQGELQVGQQRQRFSSIHPKLRLAA